MALANPVRHVLIFPFTQRGSDERHPSPGRSAAVCLHRGRQALPPAYRRLDATTVDAYSTQVPPELRGQGIADKLARRFYDWTSLRGSP
jgi:predicted GNAT family acetyltransferase